MTATAAEPRQTPAERLMAIHLRELGLHFEEQYRYAPPRWFKADFAVWWREPCHLGTRLCLIEIQGGIYKKGKPCPLCGRTSKGAHGSVTGILKDNERLWHAFKNDWHMIRFTPQQVETGEAKQMLQEALG